MSSSPNHRRGRDKPSRRQENYFSQYETLTLHSLATKPGSAETLQRAIDQNNKVDPLFHVDYFNRFGVTPLQAAAFHGHAENVLVLLQNGAKPNHFSKAQIAKDEAGKDKGIESSDLHLKDWNSKRGTTALHFAVSRDNLEVVKILHSFGGDLFMVNSMGWNCFELAQRALPNRSKVVKWLKTHIAEIPTKFSNAQMYKGFAFESSCVCHNVLEELQANSSPILKSCAYFPSPASASVISSIGSESFDCDSSIEFLSPLVASAVVASKLPATWSKTKAKMQSMSSSSPKVLAFNSRVQIRRNRSYPEQSKGTSPSCHKRSASDSQARSLNTHMLPAAMHHTIPEIDDEFLFLPDSHFHKVPSGGESNEMDLTSKRKSCLCFA